MKLLRKIRRAVGITICCTGFWSIIIPCYATAAMLTKIGDSVQSVLMAIAKHCK